MGSTVAPGGKGAKALSVALSSLFADAAATSVHCEGVPEGDGKGAGTGRAAMPTPQPIHKAQATVPWAIQR